MTGPCSCSQPLSQSPPRRNRRETQRNQIATPNVERECHDQGRRDQHRFGREDESLAPGGTPVVDRRGPVERGRQLAETIPRREQGDQDGHDRAEGGGALPGAHHRIVDQGGDDRLHSGRQSADDEHLHFLAEGEPGALIDDVRHQRDDEQDRRHRKDQAVGDLRRQPGQVDLPQRPRQVEQKSRNRSLMVVSSSAAAMAPILVAFIASLRGHPPVPRATATPRRPGRYPAMRRWPRWREIHDRVCLAGTRSSPATRYRPRPPPRPATACRQYPPNWR